MVQREREMFLFNDALNTFYLRLYGVRHMVKDHSDSEKGNQMPPHSLLLSINSKGSFICTIPQTYHGLCYNSCGALAGTINSSMGRSDDPSHHELRPAPHIWYRTIHIAREETRCRHLGYSFRLVARDVLYASHHRQDNTYSGLYYTSRVALVGTRNFPSSLPTELTGNFPLTCTTPQTR